jgi:hypothetical protein
MSARHYSAWKPPPTPQSQVWHPACAEAEPKISSLTFRADANEERSLGL